VLTGGAPQLPSSKDITIPFSRVTVSITFSPLSKGGLLIYGPAIEEVDVSGEHNSLSYATVLVEAGLYLSQFHRGLIVILNAVSILVTYPELDIPLRRPG